MFLLKKEKEILKHELPDFLVLGRDYKARVLCTNTGNSLVVEPISEQAEHWIGKGQSLSFALERTI